MEIYKKAWILIFLAVFSVPIACERAKNHLEIAQGLMNEEKPDDAFNEYTKAINDNVNFAEAYYGRGCIYLSREKLEEAVSDFRKAIDIKPSYIDAHKKLAETFTKIGAPDDEFQKRLRRLKRLPIIPELCGTRCFYHKLQKRLMLSTSKKALELDPKNPLSCSTLA